MTPSASVALKSADTAAQNEPATPPGQTIQSCDKNEPREAIEVVVLDEEDHGIAGIEVLLSRGDSQTILQVTDAHGFTRFDGLVPGACQICLPVIDKDAWEKIREESLGPRKKSSGDAAWSPYDPPSDSDEVEVEEGDCIASLAFDSGWLPESLWQQNAQLHQEHRKDLHILNPGDLVKLGVIRRKKIPGATGNRYILRRKGVPEILRVRFVDFCDEPRPGISYSLSIETADGEPVPVKTGSTDGDGFVIQSIPPNAISGEIVLHTPDGDEAYNLDLGYIDPVDEISGAQGRLNNLRYSCGVQDGQMSPATLCALEKFQMDYGLEVTGELDAQTKSKLEEIHLS